MRFLLIAAALAAAPLLLASCAHTPSPRSVAVPPPMAPSTAMRSHPLKPLHPADLLASADEADVFIGRPEKFVYGSLPVFGISTFTTYTYDAQPIGNLNGSGYRYRWTFQEGVAAPLAP